MTVTDYPTTFREHLQASTDGGTQHLWDSFRDFADMGYCALAKPHQPPDRRQAFEVRYMANAKRYTREQLNHFAAMLGVTAMALDARPVDFLGPIYEAEGFSEQKYGGQYFTPADVADTMALLTIGNGIDAPVVTVSEPTCGSGQMILSAAKALGDQPAWFDATDLDQTCQHMAYIQMACAGIAGVVRRGNTITLEEHDWAVTPTGATLLTGEGEASDYLRRWLAGEGKAPHRPVMVSDAVSQLALL